jgi:transcriptional regulator with XRE-family HTH domain
MKILPGQVKAARGFLSITQAELAERAGLSALTIVTFENEQSTPTEDTLLRIQTALEAEGIEFTNGSTPGVRLLRPPKKSVRAKDA